MSTKKPTLKEKVQVYEALLHDLQLYYEVTMDSEKVKELLKRISAWSYAHRAGNGEGGEKEQQERINSAFEKLKRQ